MAYTLIRKKKMSARRSIVTVFCNKKLFRARMARWYQLEFLKYLSSRNLAAIMMETSSRRLTDLDDRIGLEKRCCNLSR